MAKQDAFTAEEWTLLRLAPSLVSGGMAAADASGIFASIKEARPERRAWRKLSSRTPRSGCSSALAPTAACPVCPIPRSMLGEGSREQQLQNFKTAVLDRVKSAVDLVTRKGSAEEAAAYRKMLADVAERAASASKEGGFLGFGGVRA